MLAGGCYFACFIIASSIVLSGHAQAYPVQSTDSYGYITEEHTVITEDGYILTIFRIIKGIKCTGELKLPPVLLMHGLLLSSDAWLDAGPDAGLAYLLSDACYDLWLGNQRGNYYARRHVSLDPDKDHKFWQFSADEIGLYDIPATVDYVLAYSGAAQLNYIGFSQGSLAFYIMCSERPEYCAKVRLFISAAPAIRQTHAKSVVGRKTSLFFDSARLALADLGVHEVFRKGSTIQRSLQFLCQFQTFYNVCLQFLALFDSEHPGSITMETIQRLYNHFPDGTSVQNMARYGQSSRSEKFEKFDYGKSQNLQVYGSIHPPEYNLSAVITAVVVLYGRNDGLVDPKDIKWLVGKLPNVVSVEEVGDPLWNHFDVPYSQFTAGLTFPKINEYLSKYST